MNVGAQESDNRGEWNDRLNALQKLSSRNLLDEIRNEGLADFAGDEVRHEEGTAFRFLYTHGFAGHGGLEVGVV